MVLNSQFDYKELSEYLIDAAQRTVSVLGCDAPARQSVPGAKGAKPSRTCCSSTSQLILDGRTLAPPVNYGIIKIDPPTGIVIDDRKRPFVVIDPRAGHGPGIGGFTADSEIGEAMQSGSSCYFIGFSPTPNPVRPSKPSSRPGPSSSNGSSACTRRADGKPVVIGNCQAGWALMMLAAKHPELLRPAHRGRIADVLLGRRARGQSHALHRRPAGGKLADGAVQRSGAWKVRWRLAGAELREPQPGQHPVVQAIQPLRKNRYGSAPLSGLRTLVGRAPCSWPARKCSISWTISLSATSSAPRRW